MTNQDNRLSVFSKENSITGLFQDWFGKKNATPELKLGDVEGSDFKRLMNKKKYKRISNTSQDTMVIETTSTQQQQKPKSSNSKKYHSSSPDFRPVVYLSNTPNSDSNSNNGLFSGKFFSAFSPRKDRYFGNDREELSKDIFPVGYQSS